MIFYTRKIYKELSEHLEKRPVTVITGMRRTGKTTLLRKLLEDAPTINKLYLDLERLDVQELFSQKNFDNIVLALANFGLNPKQKMFLALDEIQLLPQVSSVIKYLYDHYDIKFLVSGSSSYYLKNLFSESLAGRKKIFDLYPLDFGEYLTFKGVPYVPTDFLPTSINATEYERLRAYYEDFIEWGGFPEVVLAGDPKDKKDLLGDIVSSYINIDIKSLADFKNGADIYSLLKLLAGRIGSRLDYAKLASAAGLSRITVMSYLEFFEKTYLLTRLPVVAKRPDREIVKAKKLYFADNGLAGFLADLSSGTKFENAVFNQLRGRGDLRYYSLKSGKEIDFVLNNVAALEVKETPAEFDLQDLTRLAAGIDLKNSRLIGRKMPPKFRDFIWGGDIK